LKYRKPHESPLKLGIITGLIGGLLSSILPTIYFVAPWGLGISEYFAVFAILGLTGLAIGFIVGGIIGLYFRNKEINEEDDESRENKFYQSLIEKEKKDEKKKRKFS